MKDKTSDDVISQNINQTKQTYLFSFRFRAKERVPV